jgi:DNA-binding XRE family transcriptional regulator
MITNQIAYWRSMMNGGKGVSKAHLARKLRVSRSFVTKLENGNAQPGAALMLRAAAYFNRPVEAVFWLADGMESKPAFYYTNTIPDRYFCDFTAAPAKPLCQVVATPPARPAEMEPSTDKSPVNPAAKAVASPVAWKAKGKK